MTKYLFLLLVLASCKQVDNQSSGANKVDSVEGINPVANVYKTNQDASFNFGKLDTKIIDTIFQLKEVKERTKYIEQQTNGARHLKIWIVNKPDLASKYYLIKVGEDNGTNLVTHFNFTVYPDSMRIMFLDTQDDKEITLKEWRE